MTHPLRHAALAALVALAASACTQGASAPPPVAVAAVPGLTPPGFQLPGGTGCAGEIARTRAVIANDLATGNLNKPVGARFSAEIDGADAACASGRDAEAQRMVAATKARFGYR